MPFSFLNPALLLGLIGAGIPIVVHLLGRRRARERPFAAIDFLLISERRLSARRKIRHLALLVTRVVLLAAAVLALARPLLRGVAVAGSGQPVSAAVVLDLSASMTTRIDGVELFELARDGLKRELDRLPSGSEVVLIGIAAEPLRLTEGFVPVAAVEQRLDRLGAGHWSSPLEPGLLLAVEALESARRPTRLLFVVSDLQLSAMASQRAEAPAYDGIQVRIVDPLDGGSFPQDLALISAVAQDGDGASVLEVQGLRSGLANGQASPLSSERAEAVVRLLADGELRNRSVLEFAAGSDRAATLLALPDGPAFSPPGRVEILLELAEGGALAANDRLYAMAAGEPRVRVLIADGAPSPTDYHDEVYYLERAIATEPRLSARVQDVSLGVLGDLDDVDVLILANVGNLERAGIDAVHGFVAAGGGLLVTVGDRTSAERLERELGDLLPGTPRNLLVRRPGEPSLRLSRDAATDHPVFLPFDSSTAASTLTTARIDRVVAVDPAPGSRTLLRYDNGMPALLQSDAAGGVVMLWTTSIDRAWNDLPVKPVFVPLLTRLALYLGTALDRPRPTSYQVGERAPGPHEDDPPGLRFELPEGGWLEPTAAAGEVRFATPGIYRAFVGDRRLAGRDLVVNLDPAESRLERASAAQLGRLLPPDAATATGQIETRREDEAAAPLLAVLAVAFLLESWLGRRPAASGVARS